MRMTYLRSFLICYDGVLEFLGLSSMGMQTSCLALWMPSVKLVIHDNYNNRVHVDL